MGWCESAWGMSGYWLTIAYRGLVQSSPLLYALSLMCYWHHRSHEVINTVVWPPPAPVPLNILSHHLRQIMLIPRNTSGDVTNWINTIYYCFAIFNLKKASFTGHEVDMMMTFLSSEYDTCQEKWWRFLMVLTLMAKSHYPNGGGIIFWRCEERM